MVIHVVQSGDTIDSIAREYGVALSQLVNDNQLPDPSRLVVGQTLVVRFPQQLHTVQSGQTVQSIARQYGISLRQLWRNNPILGGGSEIYPGQTLVISYRQQPRRAVSVNGYAYPFIDRALLRSTLPYLSYMTPFTYGITPRGGLVDLSARALIDMAKQAGVAPLMHLSTLTEQGGFSNELARLVLNDASIQNTLTNNLVTTLLEKGYQGLDVDFEFISAADAGPYAAFIRNLTQSLNPLGLPVIVALAPKTSPTQRGLLYEGHDYEALGAAANQVLLMTYEWGYTYGPPLAVAPLPNVRRVVEYALSVIPSEKIWLGIPNYGYDWSLPFVQGESRATSISNRYAVQLALRYNVAIEYDERAQSPWFRYRDEGGIEHEVWFEDARSIRAKLELVSEYGLYGVGYWNLMRPFPQNWLVLSSLFDIRVLQ